VRRLYYRGGKVTAPIVLWVCKRVLGVDVTYGDTDSVMYVVSEKAAMGGPYPGNVCKIINAIVAGCPIPCGFCCPGYSYVDSSLDASAVGGVRRGHGRSRRVRGEARLQDADAKG